MKARSTSLTAATLSSAALLLLLSACGEDAPDTVSADGGDVDSGTQTTGVAHTPARIKIAANSGQSPAPAATAAAERTAADEDGGGAAGDAKMVAPGYWNVTYVRGDGLVDLTGARGSWFFPADGNVVTEDQKAALAATLGMTGTWTTQPADMGGGQQLGPNDGTAPSIVISTDAMSSWWYSPAWADTKPVEPCITSTDASTGEESTTCPTPVPPVNVPDKATAEASTIELLTAMGYDTTQFELETYADEWGAWVTAWLLLDGQRSPVAMYVGFGENGAVTGAGGFLARPIQGDQYELVGVDKAIERLNDQQFGWMALGSAAARSAVEGDVAVDSVGGGSTGAAEPAVDSDVMTDASDAATDVEAVEDTVVIDPMPVEPCEIAIRPAVDTGTDASTGSTEAAAGTDDANPLCPVVDPEPVVISLTGVKTDLTMVWDADNTIWLLPAYTFTAADGGMYTVIAIDDAFIELPAPVPVPEPLPVEEPTDVVTIDEGSANSLVGLTEDEALKLAESNGWQVRVVERDGESFPATMDYRTDRVNLTVTGGLVTAVTIG